MADSTSVMVEVVDLVKKYPKNPVLAVDRVSFAVQKGEVFGLLGPNGAGKTTTIGVLTTRVRATSGQAWVAGVDVVSDPVSARRHLAVVPQRNNLERGVSIRQNLLFHAAYHGVKKREREERAKELLTQFGLDERADDRIDLFSGGQMQRAMIARALMHAPEVLFLDEPSTGLDPAARLFLWDRIRELRANGVTVVLTTHDMDEAQELSDRVGIMDHGHLLALDTPQSLTRSLPGSSTLEIAVFIANGKGLMDSLAKTSGVERVERIDSSPNGAGGPGQYPHATGTTDSNARTEWRIRLFLTGDASSLLAPVARLVAEQEGGLTDLKIASPSLEDVFIDLTGRSLR
jgi:ABC-2 type transport system ATP-binding protein